MAADAVAIASVISTAAVGIAATGIQAWVAVHGRRHEGRLAAHARRLEVQRDQREFHLALSRWCVRARRVLARPSYEELGKCLARPLDLEADGIVHGDAELAQALADFDKEVDRRWLQMLEPLLELREPQGLKEQAMEAGNFAAAAEARQAELRILSDAQQHFRPVNLALERVEAVLAAHARADAG